MIFIGDSNRFWAFEPDGEVKWKTDCPPASGGLVSAIFTQEGFVGGITMHGYAVFYNRSDGTLALPVFRLPVGEPLPAERSCRDLARRVNGFHPYPDVESGIFGREFLVTNTPAVNPKTGRIYVTAAGPKTGRTTQDVSMAWTFWMARFSWPWTR